MVNALKSTHAGRVGLAAAPAAHGVTFTIEDTGPGLSPDDVERLFGSDAQAGPATVGRGGLGLAIVRLLVTRLGGTITVASDQAQGTRVVVDLPLVPVPPETPARRTPIAGRRMWVAGGSLALRTATGRDLDIQGLVVRTLEWADLARALADDDNELPEAVLVIAAAPDQATAAMARTMRARRPDIVLLAATGTGLRGEADNWRAAGFDGYLPHPARGDTIADAFAVLLGTEPAQRRFTTAHSLDDHSVGTLAVLVVDDDLLNLRLITILLERAGHCVVAADDGATAVERVVEGGIDAVMMDVQMPGTDGLEATRRIRALPTAAAEVPIVAVTANAQSQHIEACRRAGMNAVVTKPVDAATLLATLSEAVAPG